MLVPSLRRAAVLVATTAVTLSVGIAASPPALAAGTPPTPSDDTFSVVDKDAFDVLANDSDPDTPLLTVSANSQPTHGTASCLSTGACTYTATAGYVGPDSFTYTARDANLNTATATVTLTVTGAPATTNPPTPVPDEIVTKAGQAVTANVLTNDQHGANPVVTKTAGPSHGTATCSSAGSCLYTPTNGFSGYDGFSYDVADDNGTSHGTALITVVASTAGYTQVASGKPALTTGNAITQGDSGFWTVGAKPTPAGLPQQWAVANKPPSTTVTLTGPHTFVGATTTTATGWTSGTTATTRTFAPGATSLLGESTTNPLPPPLPPISQGTGGDGHVPIIVGSKVFAFFHHTAPTSVTCIDRTTGALCPGYPHLLTVGSSDTIGPAGVVGSKLYVHVSTADSYAQTTPIALYCWDTATDSTCGLIIVTRVLDHTSNIGGSAPRVVGGKLYLAADTGLLYCVDPATGSACAGFPLASGLETDLNGGYSYDSVAHGNRLFVSNGSTSTTTCFDVSVPARCAGWTPAKSLHSPDIVNHHSTAGVADGVCSVNNASGECFLDNGTTATTDGWPVNELYYSISEEAEAGTKTLLAAGLSSPGMGCWDWVTNAVCTGNHWSSGFITTDSSAATLPDAYGAAFDGTCAVGLGDPGQVFTVDPAGFSPCTSLSAGSVRRIVDLRDQRCDGTVGAATWTDLRVLESNLTAGQDFNSLTVTVSDATTNAVLVTQDVVGTSGIISLSSVDATLHPSLAVDATADSPAGNTAWADGNPPRLVLSWSSAPAQGCFQTTTAVDCSVSTDQTIGILSTPSTGSNATASLTLHPSTNCKTLTVTKSGAGSGTVTSSPTGLSSCGTSPCTGKWLAGTVVTLTASPAVGSLFGGWSGGGCSGTSTCVVTLSTDTSVTATFTTQRTVTVNKAGSGTGTVTSNPAGISCGATCSAQYANGASVALSQVASAGSVFTGWSGSCTGTGSCDLTLNADATVTATFQLLRTLTVSKSGAGTGSVSSSPAGITCGATCTADFADGTSVTLTQTADSGSVFTGWSGACTGTGACVVSMTAAKSVTATFGIPAQPTLTVTKAGTGSGSVSSSPAGISCGATCSAQFAPGTQVTLTATPAGSSTFAGWSGGGCSGTSTCVVTLNSSTGVTATFNPPPDPTLTVSKNGSGSGTVTSAPAGISCGATCASQFTSGTSITLTATAGAGSVVTGWTGCTSDGTTGSSSHCTLTLSTSTGVTATFKLLRSLTVTKAGTGTGTVTSSPPGLSCGATCHVYVVDGTQMTLSAVASAGSDFTGWSGAGCSGTGTCVLPMTANTDDVVATFTADPTAIVLTVVKAGSGTGTVTSSPAGIACGDTCASEYSSGTTVTLSAVWDADTVFAGWSGSACGRASLCTVTMNASQTITATFRPLAPRLDVVLAGTGDGDVASTPAGISCGTVCGNVFAYGTTVTLAADPVVGASFGGWSGAGCSGSGTCTVLLTDDRVVTAAFVDESAPTVTMTQPTAFFSSSRTLVAAWSARDTGGSGVNHVQAAWQRRTVAAGTFSAWTTPASWASLTTTSASLTNATSAYEYCFRARAVDNALHVGPWSASRCTRVPVDDRSLGTTGTWSRPTGQAGYFDGSYDQTTALNAVLRTTTSVSVTKVAALVTTCSSCGVVDVYVGTVKVGRLSLVSSSTIAHRWLVLPAFALRSGVLSLKVVSSGKTVRVDALGYTRV
jgi:hypothetical protein